MLNILTYETFKGKGSQKHFIYIDKAVKGITCGHAVLKTNDITKL